MANNTETNTNTEKRVLWNKTFITLLLANLVTNLSFHILVPLLPVYGLNFTASETLIGFLAASISFAALLIRPFSGVMADRGNRKKLIIITQFGAAIAILGLIIAPNIWMLIVARFIHGLLFGISSTIVTVSTIQVTPEERMGQGVGLLSTTALCGQAVAPALGIWIAGNWGYSTLFAVTGILTAIAGVIIFAIKDNATISSPIPVEKKKVTIRDLIAFETVDLALLVLIFAMITGIISNFIVIFGNERSINDIGLYFTIYASVLVITRIACGKLIDKYPFQKMVYICAIMCGAGLIIISMANSFTPLIATAVLIGAGYGVASPALQTAMIKRVPLEKRGAASATYYLGMDTSFVIGPIAMGFLVERLGFTPAFLVFCIPVFCVIPLSFIFAGRKIQK